MTSILLLFVLCSLNAFAQDKPTPKDIVSSQVDSMIILSPQDTAVLVIKDSTVIKKVRKKFNLLDFKDYPNPNKALVYSMIIPGAGQIYNKRWWKVPLVYAALGGLVYAIDYNTDNYLELNTAYRRKLNNLPHQFTDTRFDDASRLKTFRDKFDKQRQMSYAGFVVVYALGGVEAFVDAHLRDFDVSDDLSFKVKPSFHSTPVGEQSVGVGVVFMIK